MKKLVGNVPTIIGHKLPQKTFRGEGYCEQMIDVTADKFIANVVDWEEMLCVVCGNDAETGKEDRD